MTRKENKLSFSDGDSALMKLTDQTQTLDRVIRVGISIPLDC